MKRIIAEKILAESKSNYDQIAKSWNATRQNIWPEMLRFKDYLKPGDKVLDAGCGNGRLIKIFDDLKVDYLGIDNSAELLMIAKNNFPGREFFVGDFLNLDFKANTFDAVFCLAALHHIPGKKNRAKAISEFNRVLKPGGSLFMLNWHFSSPNFFKLYLKYTLSKILGKSELDFGDIYVPWQKTGLSRYVHLFNQAEIKKLLKKNGFIVQKLFISQPSARDFKNLVTIAYKA